MPQPTVAVGAGGEDRAEQLARLNKARATSLEQQFLDLLERARLPAARRRPADGRRLLRPA